MKHHTNNNLSLSGTDILNPNRNMRGDERGTQNEYRSINESSTLKDHQNNSPGNELRTYNEFDSIENLYFASETFSLLKSMLESSYYRQTALSKLNDRMDLAYLAKFVAKLSKMKVLAIPHAFEFIKYTQLNNSELMDANNALTNGMCDEVDVIALSYQREIVLSIFKIINFLFNLKDLEWSQGRSADKFPIIGEL